MKILVIRRGRAGDMVMIVPALLRLFARFPSADFEVLTSPDGVRVLKGLHDQLSRLHVYRDTRIGMGMRLRRLVSGGSYTHVFCFETDPRFQTLARVNTANVVLLSQDNSHSVHYALRCLRAVEPRCALTRPAAYLDAHPRGVSEAKVLLADSGIGDRTLLVGFHPTCSSSRKRLWRGRSTRRNKEWPAAHFAALADHLFAYAEQHNLDLRILIDLLPDEREYGERIAAASGGRVVLQTPSPDFERYKATLQRMDLLVTPDTGPMHLAAALGTPLVALFAGKDPAICGPYAPEAQYRVLRAEDMPGPERGIGAISPAQVFAACCELIEAQRSLPGSRWAPAEGNDAGSTTGHPRKTI